MPKTESTGKTILKTDGKAKSSGSDIKIRSSSTSKEPFRFSRHVQTRSMSVAKPLATRDSYDDEISESNSIDRRNDFEAQEAESKFLNDDEELKMLQNESFQDDFYDNSENEDFNLIEGYQVKNLKNFVNDTNLDNISFCSDDTVDLLQEAKNYLQKKDHLEESERILKTDLKYNTTLISSSFEIKMSNSRIDTQKPPTKNEGFYFDFLSTFFFYLSDQKLFILASESIQIPIFYRIIFFTTASDREKRPILFSFQIFY